MSRTRVLYEHPLAYAASPVSITYKGRLGEHDLVYFSNLFPGNRGIFQIDLESGGVRQLRELGALPSANSRPASAAAGAGSSSAAERSAIESQ